MIDIELSDSEIHKMLLAGTPGELAAELAFSVCFTYGQLYSQEKRAAEAFRHHILETLADPMSWRQLLPDSLQEAANREKNQEPQVIDFVAELEKRKKHE